MKRTTTCLTVMTVLAGLTGSAFAQSDGRISTACTGTKGSLLAFPAIEVKWDVRGQVIQDTLVQVTNDSSEEVFVQFYMVNGDEPIPDGPINDGHPGWNWADCQILLTPDQPTYWSAATGLPAGCQPFSVLDDGVPPGRTDPEAGFGTRVLRGFLLGWAVNAAGQEISWNQLSGSATQINYTDSWSWEYPATAFRAINTQMGAMTDQIPGVLRLDGFEYEAGPDRLLFNFNAVGARFRNGLNVATAVDTDLTLMLLTNDLRQDNFGPVTTKAKFDIWNLNETRLSGTEICITCWDQTLLSDYGVPNNFKVENLQTDVGKARIDGMSSQVCDENCNDNEPRDGEDYICSQEASLLGVAQKIFRIGNFQNGSLSAAGTSLINMGSQSGTIWYDIIRPSSGGSIPGTNSGDTTLEDESGLDLGSDDGSSDGGSIRGRLRSRR